MKTPKERKKSSSRKSSAKTKPKLVEPIKEDAESLAEAVAGGGTETASAAPVESDPEPMGADTNGYARADIGAKPAAIVELPREVIEARAYELYLQRGCVHGHHLEDWLTAERELRVKHSQANS